MIRINKEARPGRIRLAGFVSASLTLSMLSPSAALALALNEERIPEVGNPVELTGERTHYRVQATPGLAQPGVQQETKANQPYIDVVGNETEIDLKLTFSDPDKTLVRNAMSGRLDHLQVRTYNGELLPPTLRVHPGDTVRMNVDNQLDCAQAKFPKHCQHDNPVLNVTNLHSHGLWVSPAGNSDNVLLSIKPGVKFQYEYNLPLDHPSGLYWYHPHTHGSTAIQVSGGMGGALIIEGNRVPTLDKPGDLDTLLKTANGEKLPERVVVLQQIQYACRDKAGKIKKTTIGEGKDQQVIGWACDEGDIGVINELEDLSPGSWDQSNRYTTLNGKVQPRFDDAVAGQVERWRVVHAGIRDTVDLQFYKVKADAAPFPDKPGAESLWIQENCEGLNDQVKDEPCAAQVQWQYAADGLTQTHLTPIRSNVLQPGYRSEFLTVFPSAGQYCVIDKKTISAASINADKPNLQTPSALLGFVEVKAGAADEGQDSKAIIRQTLVAAAKRLPEDIAGAVVSDLQQDDIALSHFVKHKPVADDELLPERQHLAFAIGVDAKNPKKNTYMIDGKSFGDQTMPARNLKLGTAEEWVLEAHNEIPGSPALINHPFHIHVNPFMVSRICKTVSDADSEQDKALAASNDGCLDVTNPAYPREQRLKWEKGDTQYVDLKGVWKDTLFVKQGYKVYTRTRYERYIGGYVLHCHILDHEDNGMMQRVNVYLAGDSADPAVAKEGGHAGH
ncbi:multicopper oxidase domain-containing protein [Pantoea sp. Tr-811]|uniref:multicopper oxidase family protein n=1 Tax=Pantoea sp. Tr-811 TaxID=2608361 RepID=UPI00142187EB|nr:multicopper oxidase domain-containing protein [Pantoea sp. Tr-811]NIF26916.1 multicopper oxidase domain-containing protein [Pantoea sp. Tr-811]